MTKKGHQWQCLKICCKKKKKSPLCNRVIYTSGVASMGKGEAECLLGQKNDKKLEKSRKIWKKGKNQEKKGKSFFFSFFTLPCQLVWLATLLSHMNTAETNTSSPRIPSFTWLCKVIKFYRNPFHLPFIDHYLLFICSKQQFIVIPNISLRYQTVSQMITLPFPELGQLFPESILERQP